MQYFVLKNVYNFIKQNKNLHKEFEL